jgi:hypothetical protein
MSRRSHMIVRVEKLTSTAAVVPIDRFKLPWKGCFHLETAAKLLKLLERVLTAFSKGALKLLDNQADFDSAIRRFDPSRPSQPSRNDKPA